MSTDRSRRVPALIVATTVAAVAQAASGSAAGTVAATAAHTAPVAAHAPARPTARTRPATPRSVPVTEARATPDSGTAHAAPASHEDSAMTLRGGEEGTVFRTLTVEGEDRIHIQIERPEIRVTLDPTKAPGLDLGRTADVLERTGPDPLAPVRTLSAHEPSPVLARPWLNAFASGAVARFRPAVVDVERWRLTIASSKGQVVATREGRGKPPQEIAWDGRTTGGAPVSPGVTYSYVFEAWDRAGNRRNFVGQGFQVAAYRLDGPDGPTLVFSGAELGAAAGGRSGLEVDPPAPIILEAASWWNQSRDPGRPLRVTATARGAEQANAMATLVASQLSTLTIGDPARIMSGIEVAPDAPEAGTVRISAAAARAK